MANLEKQKHENKNNGDQQLQRREESNEIARTERMPAVRRDSFELMRDFMRMDPFRDFLMRDPFRDMRDMMRAFWEQPERGERAWRPDFEVRETDDGYIVTGDLPGLAAEDLEVSVTGNRLQISGKREHETKQEQGEYRTYERAYGSFRRSFDLSDDIDADKISCKLDNGVLEVVLPKKEGAKTPRRKIEIRSGKESH